MSSNWTRQVFENLDHLRLVRTDFRTPNVVVYVKSEKSWYMLNSDPYTLEEKPPYIIKPVNGVGSWRMANPDKTFVPVVELISLDSMFMNGTFKGAHWFEQTNGSKNARPSKSIIKRLQRFSKSVFIFNRFSEDEEYSFTIVNNSTLPDSYWKDPSEVIKIHQISKQVLLQLLLFLYNLNIPFNNLSLDILIIPSDFITVDDIVPKSIEAYQENALLEFLIRQSSSTISVNFGEIFNLTVSSKKQVLIFESKIFNQFLSEHQRVYLPLIYNPDVSSPHSKGRFSVPPLNDISTEIFKPPYNFGDNIVFHNHPWTEPINISMIEIPPGKFQRNATASNIAIITQPFLMSTTLITRYQFGSIMNHDPSNINTVFDKSEIYLDEPIRNIGWIDAVAFCIKLSLIEGLDPVYKVDRNLALPDVMEEWTNYDENDIKWLVSRTIPTILQSKFYLAARNFRDNLIIDFDANGYRLPTEMEYMWAMIGAPITGQNGGTDTTGYNKPFAGSNGTNAANDYTVNQTNSNPLTTKPVASKLPNELGLFDMSGNVFCYLHDRSANLPSGTITDYKNDTANTNNQVIKGGAFNRPVSELRVDFRTTNNISNLPPNISNVGFRVVRKVT